MSTSCRWLARMPASWGTNWSRLVLCRRTATGWRRRNSCAITFRRNPNPTEKEHMMSEAKIEERAGKIAQLRAFADFLEAHPEARPIYSPAVYDVVHSRAEMAARIKALGGKWDKDEDGESFKVRQTIAGVQY